MKIISFNVGDTLVMKKTHPCAPGANRMTVTRVGSDIGLRCEKCGHAVTVERVKLEPKIKKVISAAKFGGAE